MFLFFGVLFLLALATGLAFLLLARLRRAQTGLPVDARVVYSDSGAWEKVERPLFSRRYGLTGKPDYLVESDGAIIPIELKPNRKATTPRESDVMQLAAYGLLVQENLPPGKQPPSYGLLKYRDVEFQIDFTEDLYARLFQVMAAMRKDAERDDVARSHAEAPRCRACGYRAECGQSLAEEE